MTREPREPGEPAAGDRIPVPPPELPQEEAVEVGAAEPLQDRLALGGRSLREHTARGVIINSLFQIGLAGLGLLQRVAVAAFLTTSEYGFWGILVVMLLTLSWFKQIGIGEKYVQQDDPDQVRAFQKAFTLELAYTLLFYVVVVVALPLYALIYGRPEIIVPGLVMSVAFLATALHTPIWIPFRQMRFVRQRVLEAIGPVTAAVLSIALAAAGLGYWGLVIGMTVGNLAGAAVAVATSPYPLAWRFDRDALRDYFGFSWPLALSSASSLVVVQGAILAGNYTVGLAGLGALALASNFAMFADRVDSVVRRTIYPAVCAVKDRTALLFETFTKSNRLALMWALPFGVGLALFAPDLVRFVLGERWHEAEALLQVFGILIALRQVAFNWVVFFSAVGNTRPMAINGALQVGVFLAVTLPLMIVAGLTGYAIGMSVSVAAELVLRAYFLRRLFGGFRIVRHMARAVAPVIPAAALVGALRLVETGGRGAELAAAELVLYLAVAGLATWALERSLVTELAGYLRRGVGRGSVPSQPTATGAAG